MPVNTFLKLGPCQHGVYQHPTNPSLLSLIFVQTVHLGAFASMVYFDNVTEVHCFYPFPSITHGPQKFEFVHDLHDLLIPCMPGISSLKGQGQFHFTKGTSI